MAPMTRASHEVEVAAGVDGAGFPWSGPRPRCAPWRRASWSGLPGAWWVPARRVRAGSAVAGGTHPHRLGQGCCPVRIASQISASAPVGTLVQVMERASHARRTVCADRHSSGVAGEPASVRPALEPQGRARSTVASHCQRLTVAEVENRQVVAPGSVVGRQAAHRAGHERVEGTGPDARRARPPAAGAQRGSGRSLRSHTG